MSVRDVVLAGVMIFALAIGFITLHLMYGRTADIMINNTELNYSSEFVDSIEATRTQTDRLDYILFAIFIGFILAIIVSSWFVAGNPIFMFIYFIIVSVFVAVSAVLSYAWETVIVPNTNFVTLVPDHFPITNHLLNNFPIYMTIVAFIGIIVMFAKPQQ